jgi:hypothetical protein
MRGTRGWGTGMVVLATLVATLVAAGPAAAESLPAPPGFHLRASNGYSLKVLVGGNADTGQGAVLILARSRNSTVLYGTDAVVVTETSIEADLGAVGRIDVHFVPSGKEKTERSECGGKPFTFDGGRYEGVIDFEGEHGYSEAHVTAARGEAKFFLSLVCSKGGSEGIGGHSPGARLTAHDKGRAGVEFSAFKNSPSRPARFTASIEERRGRMKSLAESA